MAVEVYGARRMNGLRSVELAGGWVPYDSLRTARQDAIWLAISPKLNAEQHNKWNGLAKGDFVATWAEDQDDLYEPPHDYVPPQDGEWQGDDTKGPQGDQGEGDASQGEGVSDGNDDGEGDDESDSQDDSQGGSGGGDGEDTPVMHSEYDPFLKRNTKRISEVETIAQAAASKVKTVIGQITDLDAKLEAAAGDISLALDAASNVGRKVAALDKLVKEARLSGGKGDSGGNGAVVVRIEFVRPNMPDYEQDGVFHNQFPTLLKLAAAGQHVYLPGPPGAGKSHAAEAVSTALGYQFGAISLGPTTPESRLWGGMDANGSFHQTPLSDGLIFAEENPDKGFVYTLDEMDNGHPGIIATLNSSMANGWVLLPNGRRVSFGNNVVFVGCANTYGTGPTAEFSGRNRLDAATLDRFRYLPWDTDKGMEAAMVRGLLHDQPEVAKDWLDVWESSRKNVEAHGLKVFVTMRGALAGAKMLACGFDIFETYNMVLLNKLPAEQAKKVSPL